MQGMSGYFILERQVVTMGTIIVGGVLLVVIGGIVAGMARDKKNGKSIQCGGDCKHCGGHCH